mmetsp:Transcript_4413/g.9536  ORF Transcript_4413/g.9536 Transcript_4413/m.9536 type:complete len:279 (+) Transcript_4413:121-957(+)|eukprot:CAMPEP_0172529630 /NCGR_PEP_ID=MMETSP1067-20121228/3666_1 /TAXON_ID=265564 ORGANISM="Thalassiosira punctigera, Strain Tpunct2005C2" /NCGR_SAMPLE_ID=MMETSP1067 /ASSEMBLY_ACC=CAM_ASM_000444 /LENGTH=278 /DNA_ID=CAMNT_0013313723 /DNA_START=111 /DNA_END=947 /DNA_ORIENTATION=-
MIRPSILLILSIAALAVSWGKLPSLASSAFLAISLVPFTLGVAEETVVAADAQECKDPGTCSDDDANAVNTSKDPSSVEKANSEQTDGISLEQADESESPPSETTTGLNGERLITLEELALHTGKGGASPSNPIWLSILGKVYDVTTGEQYYGEGKGGYQYYAGRDASPCFSSGKNNAEGAAEDWREWEDKKLVSILEWARFYQDHETYEYLGLLAGSKYFDEIGNQTPYRKEFVERAVPTEKAMYEEKERKKKERMAARLARKEKREKEEREKNKQK